MTSRQWRPVKKWKGQATALDTSFDVVLDCFFFFNLYSNTSCSIEQTLQYLQDASSEVMTSESLSVDGMLGSIYFPALVLFGQLKIQGKYQINLLAHVNQGLLKRSEGFHCGKGKSLE